MDPTPLEPRSVDEAIDWLRKHFQSEPSRSLRARFVIELSGEDGGAIGLRVDEGRLEVGPSAVDAPDVRLRLPAADYFGILAGRENADLLYMSGRLEIEGDLSLAMKLRTLFRSAPA